MKMLTVMMDDDIDAALEDVSAQQGRAKMDMAAEILRKYVQTERLRQSLQDPKLRVLYEELAAKDVELAEEGMGDYEPGLKPVDQK